MTHKLLLADDSLTIQRVVELTFADEDVEVTAVGDGQLAIDRLESDPPDIVLADVDMPKRDGYEVAAYVKSHAKLAHIPVVLLTSAFEAIDEARAAAVGPADVLGKPFEPQMVISRVKALLTRGLGSQAPPPEVAPLDVPPPAMTPLDVAPPPIDLPPVEQAQALTSAGAQPQAKGGHIMSLDDYFDQLDAAFSGLDSKPLARNGQQAALGTAQPALDVATAPLDDLLERLGLGELGRVDAPAATVAVTEPPAPPVMWRAEPAPSALRAEPTVPSAEQEPEWPALYAEPVTPSPEPAVETIAAAPVMGAPVAPPAATNPFASLAAATEAAAARSAAPAMPDHVIEEVVSRVLQRLGDTVVQQTVREVVFETAERLVQQEIERIKNSSPRG